ncbi:MAG: PQQ-binding-like beta-propeller repeat protein, partial [Acidobacteria bacterium]|nr:PQQ-binding-like beta-propeller repeat protein [Acidobacteriota bacterium]
PLMLEGRLYLFYEGWTSFDARTGKEKQREKFKVNEDGLALTEADPVVDQDHIYVSGRGRVRAVDRQTGDEDWKADDLGTAAEMALVGNTLYVRTGGQFTQLKDGDIKEKGPFGVAAIDTANGKVKWRYKGADKGLTNFAFADENTIVIADKDDLLTFDARSGKRLARRPHKVDKAQFVLINESRNAVVGGQDELAAFPVGDERGSEVWRARHKAPGRGVFRTVAGIALRAAAIYFKYAPTAVGAFNVARTGLSISAAVNGFRWSGLGTRFGHVSLSTLATDAAKTYVTQRIYSYGSLGRSRNLIDRFSAMDIVVPTAKDIRGRVTGSVIDRVTPSKRDVQQSIFDRLDPIRQAERLSSFLLRRKRLAELRGNEMYFYTDIGKPFDKKGLVGVNVHTGQDARFVLASDPDPDFELDEAAGLVYSVDGSKLQAFDIINR